MNKFLFCFEFIDLNYSVLSLLAFPFLIAETQEWRSEGRFRKL